MASVKMNKTNTLWSRGIDAFPIACVVVEELYIYLFIQFADAEVTMPSVRRDVILMLTYSLTKNGV